MTAWEMEGLVVVLQEERGEVSQGVLLTKKSPHTILIIGVAMVKLHGFQFRKLLNQRLVNHQLLIAVPSRCLVFMLSDSLFQKLRHHEIRIAEQGRNAHHRSQHLGEERAAAVAQKHNIVVVNDNPYSLILNEHPMSIMQVPGAKDCCIEFNSLSKSHNMPGWRVAMISSNKTFISWILKVKSNIDNGSFRGIQLAAAEAMLNNTDEWHRENNIQNYRRRRDIAEEIMKVLDCQFDPNQVGMFLWGKIPEKYADVEDLTEKILHEARVFITPGFIFGTNGKRYIRISLCAKDEKMKEALERIRKVFER